MKAEEPWQPGDIILPPGPFKGSLNEGMVLGSTDGVAIISFRHEMVTEKQELLEEQGYEKWVSLDEMKAALEEQSDGKLGSIY